MKRLLAKGLDINSTCLKVIMTTNLRLAFAEYVVVDCLRMMSNERFRHLPVVDSQGKLINLMSQGDFVSYTWPQLLALVKDSAVKSFMERFQLYLIVGGLLFYFLTMLILVLRLK